MTGKIIALFGPQQVGKTTAANGLVARHGYKRVAFADPLYAMLAAYLDISPPDLRKLPKEEPMEILGNKSVRETLQLLGTEWGRDMISPTIWIDAARRKISKITDKGISVVIDDCRFRNEFDLLTEMGATRIRLERANNPHEQRANHASETDWPNFDYDYLIENDCSDWERWARFAADQINAIVRGELIPD